MDRAAKVKLINQATGDPKMRAKLDALLDEEVEAPKPVKRPLVVTHSKQAAKKKVAKKGSKK